MTRFRSHPGCTGARPCPGRSSSGLTALRGLHLDSACAPAVTWQLAGSGTTKISSIQSVHAFRGTPILTLGARTDCVLLLVFRVRDLTNES